MFSGKNLAIALKALKESTGLTTNQISDKCGLPASTISRILSGQTDNPTIQTLYDIVVIGMGGSIDALVGVTSSLSSGEKALYENMLAYRKDEKQRLIDDKDKIIADKNEIIKSKDAWIRRLFIIAIISIIIATAYLVWDITTRGVGAFK